MGDLEEPGSEMQMAPPMSTGVGTASTPEVASRYCVVCNRPDGVVQFSSDVAVRCTDCARAHGAAVSAQKRGKAPQKDKTSPRRPIGRAAWEAKRAADDSALQERAVARAAARGECYEVKATLTDLERLVLKSEEETERRLERDRRRASRARAKAESAAAVAFRKAARRPCARLARSILPEVDAAKTLDDEILALAAGLDERARKWMLQRWGYLQWPPPSLDSLGAAGGVTRERVRQVTSQHESRLQELTAPEWGLRLTLAERAIRVLINHGGMLGTLAFTSALRAEGVEATGSALHALLALSAARLVPPVLWHEAADLWVDEAHAGAVRDGTLERARRRFLVGARRALRRTGTISLSRLASAQPIPPEHAIALLFGPTPVSRVSAYLVPQKQKDSKLSRCARNVAAISPGVGVEDIRRGLHRITPKPIRMPAPVVRAVLAAHPAFRLDGGSVFLVDAPELSSILYPADLVFIDALRARGGVMLFQEVKALLSSTGISLGYFQRAAHAEWVVGIRGGFGLRGHPATARVPETNERRTPGLKRSRVFLKLTWPDADSAVVRYRVMPASLRGGLRVPRDLAVRLNEAGPDWSVTATPPIPTGSTISVGADGESLWDLRPWLLAAGAQSGQHIELSASLGPRQICLRLVSRDDAEADEALWRQEQLSRAARRRADHTGRGINGGQSRNPWRKHAPRKPSVTVKQFGSYFDVPNEIRDLSGVTFWRLRGSPAPTSDLLVAALPDFPLAPGTTGVIMCLVFPLSARQGKRRLYSELLETRLLERATKVTHEEAVGLVRHLERHLVRARLSLVWREYRPSSDTAAAEEATAGTNDPASPQS